MRQADINRLFGITNSSRDMNAARAFTDQMNFIASGIFKLTNVGHNDNRKADALVKSIKELSKSNQDMLKIMQGEGQEKKKDKNHMLGFERNLFRKADLIIKQLRGLTEGGGTGLLGKLLTGLGLGALFSGGALRQLKESLMGVFGKNGLLARTAYMLKDLLKSGATKALDLLKSSFTRIFGEEGILVRLGRSLGELMKEGGVKSIELLRSSLLGLFGEEGVLARAARGLSELLKTGSLKSIELLRTTLPSLFGEEGILARLGNSLSEILKTNSAKAIEGLRDAFPRIFGEEGILFRLSESLKGFLKENKAIEYVTEFGKSLGSIFGEEGMLFKFAKSLGGLLKMGGTGIIEGLGRTMSFVFGEGGIFARIAKAVGSIGEIGARILGLGGITRFIGKILWPITVLMSIYDGVTGWFNTEGIKKAGGDPESISARAISAVSSIFTGIFKPLTDLADWISNKLGGGGIFGEWSSEDIMNKIFSLPATLKKVGASIAKLFTEFEDNFIGGTVDWVKSVFSAIVENIKSGFSWGKGLFTKLYNAFFGSSEGSSGGGSGSKRVIPPMHPRSNVVPNNSMPSSSYLPPPTPPPPPTIAGTQASPNSGTIMASPPGGGTISTKTSKLQPTESIRKIITDAADMAGVDRNYMLATAERESGFDPTVVNKTGSSAGGLFQFTNGTWKDMVAKYGSQYGIGLNDKFDARSNATMGALFTRDNKQFLERNGIRATNGHLYLAHFLGAQGAVDFIRAVHRNPNTPTEAYFPKDQYNVNPNMHNKTIGQFYGETTGNMEARANKYSVGGGTVAASTPIDENNINATTASGPTGIGSSSSLSAAPKPTMAATPVAGGTNLSKNIARGTAGRAGGMSASAGTRLGIDDIMMIHDDSGLVIVNSASI